MVDDTTLVALGRQYIEFCAQREILYRQVQALQARVAELEKAAASPPKAD